MPALVTSRGLSAPKMLPYSGESLVRLVLEATAIRVVIKTVMNISQNIMMSRGRASTLPTRGPGSGVATAQRFRVTIGGDRRV